MADTQVTFGIKLEDEVTATAETAAGAMASLQERIVEDESALKQLQVQLRRLKGAGVQGASAVKILKDQIAAKRVEVGKAQGAIIGLADKFKIAATSAKQLRPPIESAGKSINLLATAAKGLILYQLGKLAFRAAEGFAKMAFGMSDAVRTAKIMTEASLVQLVPSMRKIVISAGDVETVIDRVSNASASGVDELRGFATSLAKAGYSGQDFETALTAIGQAESVGRGAEAMQLFQDRMYGLGRSTDATAKLIDQKFGAMARKRFLSLDVQAKKLKDNLGKIFAGMGTDAVLKAIASLASLFSQTTVAGLGLTELFNGIGDVVTAVEPYIKQFFKGLIIAALFFEIQLIKVYRAIKKAFGAETFAGLGDADAVLYATIGIFGLLAAVMVAGITITVGALVLLWKTINLIADAIAAVIIWVIKAIKTFTDWQAHTSAVIAGFANLGGAMIDGIVQGIKAGAGRVLDAIKGLGTSAMGALKGVLGIASPSKEFAKLGVFTAEGFAVGTEKGQGRVEGAVGNMVSIPAAAPSQAAQGGASGGGSTNTQSISIGDVHVNAPQAKDAGDIGEAVRKELTRALEGLAIMSAAA